jgi:hypothetical protein
MNRISLICHFVFVFVTVVTANSFGSMGPSCASLFKGSARTSEFSIYELKSKAFDQESFKSPEIVMTLLQNGVLDQIRTSNPSKDHIEFFSAQVPLILSKILVAKSEAAPVLSALRPVMNSVELTDLKTKIALKNNLDRSYEALVDEAIERVESRTVTYEWYMSFFLRTLIYSDVTSRVLDQVNSSEKSYVLNKKLDTASGRTKMFFGEEAREINMYATMEKFARYLPENPIIPVLFIPKDSDIVNARPMGLRFVSFVSSRKDTVEGKKFPLKFAAFQVEQNINEIRGFKKDLNPKSTWDKIHNRIAPPGKSVKNSESRKSLEMKILNLPIKKR